MARCNVTSTSSRSCPLSSRSPSVRRTTPPTVSTHYVSVFLRVSRHSALQKAQLIRFNIDNFPSKPLNLSYLLVSSKLSATPPPIFLQFKGLFSTSTPSLSRRHPHVPFRTCALSIPLAAQPHGFFEKSRNTRNHYCSQLAVDPVHSSPNHTRLASTLGEQHTCFLCYLSSRKSRSFGSKRKKKKPLGKILGIRTPPISRKYIARPLLISAQQKSRYLPPDYLLCPFPSPWYPCLVPIPPF